MSAQSPLPAYLATPPPVPPIDPARVAESRAAIARRQAIVAISVDLADMARRLHEAGEMEASTLAAILDEPGERETFEHSSGTDVASG